MAKLRNLNLNEFSLVRGADLQPANPESTVAFYKAKPRAKESSMAETTENAAAATPTKPSIAKQIEAAVRGVIAKAKQTTTYNYSSTSTETRETDEPTASDPTVIVVQQSTEKTEPAAAAEPAGDPIEGVSDFVKAIEPLVQAVTKMDSRLVTLEKASSGSRALRKGIAMPITVTDNSGDRKFPDFTKFLAQKSGLSAGQQLTKATIVASGWTYGLSQTEAANFIDYIVDESTLLKLIRTINMPAPKHKINKIGLGSKVLKKGTPGTDPGDTVSVDGPSQIELDAEEVVAIVSVGDDTVEDNIEGDAFVQHLLGMVGRAAANELEQAGIHADEDVPDDYILDRFDGWLKLATDGNAPTLDAMDDDDRYWPGARGSKATRILKQLATKYRNDLRQLAWILHPDLYLDYNDALAELGIGEAFTSITGVRDVPLRGVKNVQVPMLKTDIAFTSGGQDLTDGSVVILTDLRNLILGIHRQIRIEPQRSARKRATDYVLSMRVAAQIENPDAMVIYNHAASRQ